MNFFYSLNSEAYESISHKLSSNELDVTLFEEDRIEGTVTTAEDGTVMLTTIPYDEGWHITVDGEEIEYSKALDSLISFKLDSGEHTIVMRYMSKEFKTGAAVSLSGIFLFILICVADKFLFPILLKKAREAKESFSKKIRARLFDESYDEAGDTAGKLPSEAQNETQTNEGNEEI